MLMMDSVVRWERAAQRALAADLPRQLRRRGGAILVPSKSRDGVTYHVRLDGGRAGQCDCEAGLYGRPCVHRAAVAIRLWERQTGARLAGIKQLNPRVLERYIRAA